jgi:hypothetical protein
MVGAMITHDEHHDCGVMSLLPYVTEARRQEFIAHVKEVVDANFGDIDPSFLGFMSDYMNYNDLLVRKADTTNPFPDSWSARKEPPVTVFDIGCANALQHVVFDERIHYVGIDGWPTRDVEPKFFRDNCRYVRGRFRDLVTEKDGVFSVGGIVVHENAWGIANMSLYYGSRDEIPLFDRVFPRKFIL